MTEFIIESIRFTEDHEVHIAVANPEKKGTLILPCIPEVFSALHISFLFHTVKLSPEMYVHSNLGTFATFEMDLGNNITLKFGCRTVGLSNREGLNG